MKSSVQQENKNCRDVYIKLMDAAATTPTPTGEEKVDKGPGRRVMFSKEKRYNDFISNKLFFQSTSRY